MSTFPQTTDAANERTTTPEVTDHAVLRFRQRIDGSEPFPKAKIDEMLAHATPQGDHPRVHDGIAWVAADAVLVTDSSKEAVTTVLRRREGA